MGLYIFTWFLYVSFVKVKPLPFDDQSEEELTKQEYKEIWILLNENSTIIKSGAIQIMFNQPIFMFIFEKNQFYP